MDELLARSAASPHNLNVDASLYIQSIQGGMGGGGAMAHRIKGKPKLIQLFFISFFFPSSRCFVSCTSNADMERRGGGGGGG